MIFKGFLIKIGLQAKVYEIPKKWIPLRRDEVKKRNHRRRRQRGWEGCSLPPKPEKSEKICLESRKISTKSIQSLHWFYLLLLRSTELPSFCFLKTVYLSLYTHNSALCHITVNYLKLFYLQTPKKRHCTVNRRASYDGKYNHLTLIK